jgi:predicted transcriptional regulator
MVPAPDLSAGIALDDSAERSRIMLDLLQSVERDGSGSQRRRASEFGVALGLVNAYLTYCVKKGYVKVRKIPARRYVYFLTPKGFAEKSRLTMELVSKSLSSFRTARTNYSAAFRMMRDRGQSRAVLMGQSELAEICVICAAENDIALVALVRQAAGNDRFAGLTVVSDFTAAPSFDAVVITDLSSPQSSYDQAVAAFGAQRVYVPAILGVSSVTPRAAAE